MTQPLSNTIDIRIPPLNDLTDFTNANFNGWIVEPYTFYATIIDLGEPAGAVLFGNSDKQYTGVVLSKTFTGLVPGEPYRMSYRARKSADIPNVPQNLPYLRAIYGEAVIIEGEPLVRMYFIEYDGQFEAKSDTVKIDFVSVGEEFTQGFGNFYLNDIHVYGREEDLTDFNDGTWGLWQPTRATETAVFRKGRFNRGTVLHFETFGDDTDVNAGDVLTRTFTDLTPGTRYTFSVEAIYNIGHPVPPILSLTQDGQELGARFTPQIEKWGTYSRDFVATANTRLSIRSHVGTGRGNDYSLNNLRIVEKW